MKWNVIPSSPTDKATPPSRQPRPVTPPDPQIVVDIIAAARESDPVLSAGVVVAATTGLRRREICGLRWSDVDLGIGTLHVRRAIRYDADRKAVPGPTKTHQERRLALDPGTVVVLTEHSERAAQWALNAEVTLDADPYVFTLDPSGSLAWTCTSADLPATSARSSDDLGEVKLDIINTIRDLQETHPTWTEVRNSVKGNTKRSKRVYDELVRDGHIEVYRIPAGDGCRQRRFALRLGEMYNDDDPGSCP